MNLRGLLENILQGTIFGSSPIGRAVGWCVSLAILGTILYLLSRLV